MEIGNLALGARDVNQTFSRGAGIPNANGTLLPSTLFSQGVVPSNSYGLHIGSVALSIPSSLYIGGYDRSRVLGIVSAQPYGLNSLPVDLLDIGIGVAVGNSPFKFTSKSGLLAQGNSSISIAIQTRIDSVAPYLYLPKSTCDAITAELPVIFQPEFGIYFWDTTSIQYEMIVSSPSYIRFTFRLDGGISANMTINVPFSLLNLTLTTPVVTVPTQYFPCFPINDSSPYILGKAFLQASFFGVLWQENHEGVWVLAQAPGPNTPSLPSVAAIDTKQKSIAASENIWVDTWKDTWTPIGPPTINIPSSNNNSTAPIAPPPTKKGLLKGFVVGIVASAIIGLGLCVFGFVWLKKKRNSRRASCSSSINSTSGIVQIELQHPRGSEDRKQLQPAFSMNEIPVNEIVELQSSWQSPQKSKWRFTFSRNGPVELPG
ncbi:aspartic-type endopeptidase [Phlyctema vagabunda]|uniref:Aspartic-type endopeptidase n=1 Tax=Phlyctema vagabunda TaxID=108571 RepID=A0ABR4P5G0_9HELO